VHAHERVATLDILEACVSVVAVEVGVRGAVDGVATVDDAEGWGELLVGGVAGCPEGVAADGRDGVVVQVGYAGWLALVDSVEGCWFWSGVKDWVAHDNLQISMPPLRADGFAETGLSLRSRKIRPDDCRALQARHMRYLRVDLDFAVVLAELQLLLRAQVLVTEEDNTSLSVVSATPRPTG